MTESTDNTQYLNYVQETTSTADLSKLQDMAEAQAKAEAEVRRIEADLQKAREHLRDISERQLPDLMDEIGLETFKTRSGLTIKVKETIRASIPKAKAPQAFAWLKAHNFGALIKRSVSIAFGKGEDELADNFVSELESKYGYDVDDKSNVHPATLSSFVKEKLENGEELPLDLFGVHRQRVTKIEV